MKKVPEIDFRNLFFILTGQCYLYTNSHSSTYITDP